MRTDTTAVVDGQLRTYGVGRLRIADASIMTRITAGNTMAPCVAIGEQASDFDLILVELGAAAETIGTVVNTRVDTAIRCRRE